MRSNVTSLRLNGVVFLLVFLVSMADTASAQTLDAKGPVSAAALASASELVQNAGRRSDSLWNGALIGAGIGVATHLFVCTRMEPWRICREDFGPMARFAAIGAGLGIAVDLLIRPKAFPNVSPGSKGVRATPLVGRGAGGLQVSVGF